jgi:hypothetical protein
LTPADADGVVACVRAVYGDTYIIHTELYHIEQILKLNESGRLISIVALSAPGHVVGHYALERHDFGSPVAESGEAMVLPEHQHHHLLERMRTLLEEEGRRLGLRGIFGRTVTNHVYSQKAVERFGEQPCGVGLGRTPKSFRNMSQALPQRMSIVFYFKYLDGPAPASLFLPERHQPIARRIFTQFDVPLEFGRSQPLQGQGDLDVAYEEELLRATFRVRRTGEDLPTQIASAKRQVCASGAEVIFLELPLADPAAPALCESAEDQGFFFCGIAPQLLPQGDALRMQWLGVNLDLSLLQIENPFARELLAYAAAERMQSQVTQNASNQGDQS